MDDETHAERIEQLLTDEYTDEFDLDERIVMALADLRHLCTAKNLDFFALDRLAHLQYAGESERRICEFIANSAGTSAKLPS